MTWFTAYFFISFVKQPFPGSDENVEDNHTHLRWCEQLIKCKFPQCAPANLETSWQLEIGDISRKLRLRCSCQFPWYARTLSNRALPTFNVDMSNLLVLTRGSHDVGISPWQINLIGGQHGRRDVTKALLLPPLRKYVYIRVHIYTNWPPPVHTVRSVGRYAIIGSAHVYCSPLPEPLVHKNSNKEFFSPISWTAHFHGALRGGCLSACTSGKTVWVCHVHTVSICVPT
jgi:hypothetical protein